MPRLSLSLMGRPLILLDAQPVTGFKTQKVEALLTYLAVESAHAHTRAELTGLFWPEQPEVAARTNLRVALHRLRRALGEGGQEPFLQLDRTTAGFNLASDHWLDVAQFNALLAQTRTHPHERLSACASCTEALAQAVALYRGNFLEGVALGDAAAFEEWVLVQRENLRRETLSALDTLIATSEVRTDYKALAQFARRQLELEPWHEPAYRHLMRALALSGQRSAALAQYEECRRLLQHELGIEPDIATHALYERIRAGELGTTRLMQQTPPHNLPYQLTPFIGRAAELAEIAAWLQQSDARLLSLAGPGGMGKTRLAMESARAHINVFDDGVFFVSLAPVVTAAEIAPTIVATLGLQLHGATPEAALVHYLADKKVLLILDNFEHVLDGARLVVELLHSAPRLRVIVTSRERLNVRGEQLLLVEGMDYAASPTAGDAASSPAVSIFTQSARRVQPAFTVTARNLPAILSICALTKGMPLALELAAAWVELFSPGQIASEIERSADFLAMDWSDAPERQRSLRAVFEWSWRLLDEHERTVFRQLSIFRGGFTRDAALAVVGATQRALTRLTHKSLLHWRAVGGTGRFEIHELLRQYAAEQLAQSGAERADVEVKHRDYYLTFAALREQRITCDDPRAALDEIGGELDNIRQAWSSASVSPQAESLARSAYALWQYYWLSGLWDEGIHVFAHAAEHAAATPALQSKLIAAQVHLLNHQGKYHDAIPLAQHVITLAQSGGGLREGEAAGELLWAQALLLTGQMPESREHVENALRLASAGETEWLRDIQWEAWVWLGAISGHDGDYQGSLAAFSEGLRLCQFWRKRNGEARCYGNLAALAASQRDHDRARQLNLMVLRLARALGNRWLEGVAETDLAENGLIERDYAEVVARAGRALQIFFQLGDRLYQLPALGTLARLMDELGQYERAREWVEQVVQVYEEVGTVHFAFLPLCSLALHAHHIHDGARALAWTDAMRRTAQQMHESGWLAQTHVVRGHVLAGLERCSEAEAEYTEAIAGYADLKQDTMLNEPRAGLASLALARGDSARALTLVELILKDSTAQLPPAVDDPFFIALVCYRVLAANGDLRAAAFLQTAQTRLRALAETILDPAQRDSYLERVPIHRELLHLMTTHQDFPPL